MSYWVAGAAIGSALIGAYSSNKASKTAADSSKNGLNQSSALADQSRNYALGLYEKGQKNSQQGLTSAFDFYKQNIPSKYAPFIQGNVAAQKAIGQGAQQANNAILGLPVDMSFANQQTELQPNYSAIQSAQLPNLDQSEMGPQQTQQADAPAAQQTQPQKSGGLSSALTANGYLADPREVLNPATAITNPLATIGVGKKITDKVDPVKTTKKLLSKLF